MPLIGTAGHVDHGKSSLIQRLTGRDPDRWAEEKRRGLTIDLGFAWTTLPNGTEVSFVDVPGHERYLKNMLAGIEAIDIALFVVAADEGWMPQSEEHLAVLDLLGVNRGLVALTKTDAVEADLLELAQIECFERLEGTSLQTAQVVPVSSVSGDGIDDLIEELERLVTEVAPRDVGRPRLWVDRSFSAKGSGTVATGTLIDGALSVDQKVRVYPSQRTARIRTIQSHETSLPEIQPGRRVALNLSGIDKEDVRRGEMVGHETHWAVTTRFLASLTTARYVEEFERRGAYQLHIGSGVHSMEITGLADGMTVIQTRDAIPVAWGDRFIIRDTGRKLVVAGGRVLDPSPGATASALISGHKLVNLDNSDEVADVLLSQRRMERLDRLSAQTLGGTPLSGQVIGESVFSTEEIDRLTLLTCTLVESEHDAFPLRVGLSLATLANTLGVEASVAEEIVDQDPTLERRGPEVAVAGRKVELDPASEADWQTTQKALNAGLGVPLASELDLDAELLHLKVRTGELVSVADDLVFLPFQIAQIKATMDAMEDDFTVADFRDAIGLSRKYVVPILEWADKEGLTVRRGDTRRVR